jgi:hypothetical protein
MLREPVLLRIHLQVFAVPSPSNTEGADHMWWLAIGAQVCISKMVRSTYNHRGCLAPLLEIVASATWNPTGSCGCRPQPSTAPFVFGDFSLLDIFDNTSDEPFRPDRAVAPELTVAMEAVESIDGSTAPVNHDCRLIGRERPDFTPSRRIRRDDSYFRGRTDGTSHRWPIDGDPHRVSFKTFSERSGDSGWLTAHTSTTRPSDLS